MSKQYAGHITGLLQFVVEGAEPIDIGGITLPLEVISIPASSGYLALGLGVNLDSVRNTVAAIFDSSKEGGND